MLKIFLNYLFLASIIIVFTYHKSDAAKYSKKVCTNSIVIERAMFYLNTPNLMGKKLSLYNSYLVHPFTKNVSCEYKIVGSNEYDKLVCLVPVEAGNLIPICRFQFNPEVVPRDGNACNHPIIHQKMEKFLKSIFPDANLVYSILLGYDIGKVSGDMLTCAPNYELINNNPPMFEIKGKMSCEYQYSKKKIMCTFPNPPAIINENFCNRNKKYILNEYLSISDDLLNYYDCASFNDFKNFCNSLYCQELSTKYQNFQDLFAHDRKLLAIIRAHPERIQSDIFRLEVEIDRLNKQIEYTLERHKVLQQKLRNPKYKREEDEDYSSAAVHEKISDIKSQISTLHQKINNYQNAHELMKIKGTWFFCFYDPIVKKLDFCHTEK